MTAKNDLKRYKAIYYEVKFLRREIEGMYNTLKAVNYDEKTGTASGDDLTLIVVTQILKKKEYYEARVKELWAEEERLLKRVDKIDNADIKRILLLRYIGFMPWAKIARETNYSESRIMQLHREGLTLLDQQEKER